MRPTCNVLLLMAALAGCQKPIELAWEFEGGSGSRGSPALTADLVLYGDEAGYLTAIDRSDGSLRWRFATSKEIIGAPAVDALHAYVGSTNYSLYGVDLSMGRAVWEWPTHDRIKGPPALAGGIVYAGSYDGHLYAVRAATGKLVWQFPVDSAGAPVISDVPPAQTPVGAQPARAAAYATGAPKAFSYARPLVAGGVVYAGNLDGDVYAFDARTGALRWRVATGGGVTSSPAADHGVLYFGSNDHKVYALENLGGAAPSIGWTFPTGDQVNAGPLVVDGALYIGGTDKVFYALDAATGKKKWSYSLPGPIYGRAVVYQNLVFVGAGVGGGGLYAFDRQTGRLFWHYDIGPNRIQNDLSLDGNHLFVVTGSGNLLAFQINKTKG